MSFGTDPSLERSVFDKAALLESVGGNGELLKEVVGLFLNADAPRLIADLAHATAKRDAKVFAGRRPRPQGIARRIARRPRRRNGALASKPADIPAI